MDERNDAWRRIDGNEPFELRTDPDWIGDRVPNWVPGFKEEMVIMDDKKSILAEKIKTVDIEPDI